MNDSSMPSPWQATRYEIKVRYDPLDMLSFMQTVRWSMIERVVAWLPPFGLGCVGAVGALLLSEPLVERLPAVPYLDWALVIALVGALVAYLILKVFIMGPYVDSTFSGQPIGMGDTTIVVDERGITSTTVGVTLQMPWSAIRAVVAKDDHLFLMFSRLVGIIVPRRAFSDSAEAARFSDFVRARVPTAA